MERCDTALASLSVLPSFHLVGWVRSAAACTVEIAGLRGILALGDRVSVLSHSGQLAPAEVVACNADFACALVQGALTGTGCNSPVFVNPNRKAPTLPVSQAWMGRIIDPLGRPLDGGVDLPPGLPMALRASPPAAVSRARLGLPVELGVRVLDAFTTCRAGQRLGLFAASGVGKSTLLGMIARFVACDVIVLALVGERGREVREFLEDNLGADGAARAVTVIATSDSSPLLRREAAYSAITVAEYFRDQGQSVLLLMDSLTRFCHALREIALAAGEIPASRGFPVSVFTELPKLLERAGPGVSGAGRASGHITAIFTVLVEGDDHDEPIADSARGILDGHIVLDRGLAETGRLPAVDVSRSISRAAAGCLSSREAALASRGRALLTRYTELFDLIRLGAYHRGEDPDTDTAVTLAPRLHKWLCQDRRERSRFRETFEELEGILAGWRA